MAFDVSFKAHVKYIYAEWMTQGLYDLTPTGNVCSPDVALFVSGSPRHGRRLHARWFARAFRDAVLQDETEDDIVYADQ